MCFGAWVLVPLQGAAARCVAACALELGCWCHLRALQSIAAGCCCQMLVAVCGLEPACPRRCYGAAHKYLLLSGIYVGVMVFSSKLLTMMGRLVPVVSGSYFMKQNALGED